MMYKYKPTQKTSIKLTGVSYEGETIEEKMNRVVNNKEPITDGAPLVYQERSEGVKPQYDIRADKWDIAVDAMHAVNTAHQQQRNDRIKEKEAKIVKLKDKESGNPSQSTQEANS